MGTSTIPTRPTSKHVSVLTETSNKKVNNLRKRLKRKGVVAEDGTFDLKLVRFTELEFMCGRTKCVVKFDTETAPAVIKRDGTIVLYAKAEGDFTARTKFLIYKKKGSNNSKKKGSNNSKKKGSNNSVGYMRAKLGAAVHELGGTEG